MKRRRSRFLRRPPQDSAAPPSSLRANQKSLNAVLQLRSADPISSTRRRREVRAAARQETDPADHGPAATASTRRRGDSHEAAQSSALAGVGMKPNRRLHLPVTRMRVPSWGIDLSGRVDLNHDLGPEQVRYGLRYARPFVVGRIVRDGGAEGQGAGRGLKSRRTSLPLRGPARLRGQDRRALENPCSGPPVRAAPAVTSGARHDPDRRREAARRCRSSGARPRRW